MPSADVAAKASREAEPYAPIFPADEFVARRARVLDAIGDGAYALLQGAGPVAAYDVFRQSNDFQYLCGVEEPHALLLLDGSSKATTLYLPPHGRSADSQEEPRLGLEDAEAIQRLFGIERVCAPEQLLGSVREARVLYIPHAPAEGALASRDVLCAAGRAGANDPWDSRLTREAHFVGLVRSRFPRLEVRDLSPILDRFRLVKSPREVDVLRRAAQLSAQAVVEAMRSTQPGVIEYELAALAKFVFERHGARGPGYRAIVAGGGNAWYPHYCSNQCPLSDGDLVLMDCAPDYHYYTSDIGRMWPVNGTYNAPQRDLYGFIVEYHKAVLARIRPGVMAAQVLDEAAEHMAGTVQGWAFSKQVYRQAAERTLEFRGHLSHPVGMAVHDVGDYHDEPLAPGTVFTVDPQMWVPEERLYVRVEDTVVLTDEGVEVLTGAAPLDLDDVERLMREPGPL
jgi:Xaa-Pro aminopeptidase